MVTTPFRTSPVLGPGILQSETQQYWDGVTDTLGTGQPSYQPGSTVKGSDGHDYTYVKAHAALAANAQVGINEATWVTQTGTTHTAPAATAINEWFHARKAAL